MTQDPGLANWLQLTLTPGLGAAAIRGMLRQFGLPHLVLARKPAELAPHAAPTVVEALHSESVRRAVEAALAWLEQPGNALVTLADATYPRLLLEISDPPPVLYARGRLDLLQRPALAIVGSRNATAQGAANGE